MQYGVADRYLGQRMLVRFGGRKSRSVFQDATVLFIFNLILGKENDSFVIGGQI